MATNYQLFKKTGMSIKDIRKYIILAMEGDKTIDERLELFKNQRKALEAQIAELQRAMNVLNFKCWYYETAKEAGTVDVPQSMSTNEIPEEFRKIRKDLRNE